MSDRVKRWVSLLLRIAVAIAGVAFIVGTLTWRDAVVLPAGWETPGGARLGAPLTAAVREVAFDGDGRPIGELTVELPAGVAGGGLARVDAAELGPRADQARFKAGVLTTLRGADVALLAVGLVMIGSMFPLQAYRWLILMRCRGLDVGFGKAFRLTMVGQFFNFCMPGMTGGDVAKAYYASKNSDKRGAAIMSVVFDRVAGLFGLILLAGLVGLTRFHDPLVRKITVGVWVALAGVTACAAVYFSHRVRGRLNAARWLGALPFRGLIGRVDAAALAYSNHKGTVLAATFLSLPVHLFNAGATALAGYALGMEQPLALLLTVVPILLLAGAAPLTYQGLGVMEGLAIAMLREPGLATANQIVGMLLLLRIFLILWALGGSLELLRGDIHMFPAQPEGDGRDLAVAPTNP